ncbi:MAG TPA: hypothetical protein VMT86_08195 [Bryobacteraceae bacterium]|nr:hypothetical protein [Bryobacteraceae bacterium]
MKRAALLAGTLLAGTVFAPARAQDPVSATPPPSIQEKWRFFEEETINPFVPMASGITAGIEQSIRADPQYGVGARALAERFGAAVGDNVSQNFFSDFAMASLLHEDTQYRRRGEGHGFWSRLGYAVSRAFVTRKDSGGATANWSNFLGCGLQAGLSSAYYPPPSRTLSATAINWANSVGASGLGNLFPEFLPDFKRWLKRHHL